MTQGVGNAPDDLYERRRRLEAEIQAAGQPSTQPVATPTPVQTTPATLNTASTPLASSEVEMETTPVPDSEISEKNASLLELKRKAETAESNAYEIKNTNSRNRPNLFFRARKAINGYNEAVREHNRTHPQDKRVPEMKIPSWLQPQKTGRKQAQISPSVVESLNEATANTSDEMDIDSPSTPQTTSTTDQPSTLPVTPLETLNIASALQNLELGTPEHAATANAEIGPELAKLERTARKTLATAEKHNWKDRKANSKARKAAEAAIAAGS